MTDTRPDLLFLCHRIPYPPDKGDKIRSYRWLAALAARFRVHLGTFVDDPLDWGHVERLQGLCASSLFLPLSRRLATLRSARGLLDGRALTFPYYADRRMRRWVDGLLEQGRVRHVFVFSAALAQYVTDPGWAAARRIVDFVDVDSDKWRQYAQRQRWPGSWVYAREARRLADAEVEIARAFDLSLFVSAPEAEMFRPRLGAAGERVAYVENGVDCDYFNPDPQTLSPYPPGREAVVFTGAMDYWANADAVLWLAREIWPSIRAVRPQALLAIVGARPGPEVLALASPDILVTGRVPDVRPYIQHACCAVAPLRVARGIQNKVLEAMAMAKPVVTTGQGLEGIDAVAGLDLLVEDAPGGFADAVLATLGGGQAELGPRARRLVRERYSWASASARLVEMAMGDGTTVPRLAGVSAVAPGDGRTNITARHEF